ASLSAQGTGSVDLVASVTVRIHLLFFTISKTAHFDIGTVQLPKPVYLAGGVYQGDASKGTAIWSSGTLYMNMGSRDGPQPNAGACANLTSGNCKFPGRGIGDDNPNETFIIDHLGGGAGDEDIQVTGMGRHQEFDHVSSLYADGGGGNDTLIVNEGVLSPAELHGGTGDDTLIYRGSGYVKLYGEGDDDYLEVGPKAAGSIYMDGGAGNDYLLNSSDAANATMLGGGDDDILIGGTGANASLDGGAGNDEITGNG